MDEQNHDEEFNPIGTVWILIIFFLLIIAFWGYAYLELLVRS